VTAVLSPAFAQTPSHGSDDGSAAVAKAPLFALAGSTPQVVEGSPAVSGGINTGVLKNLKFQGLVQGWYQQGSEGFVGSFRLRRTELGISGDVTSRARFMVMIDPSKALSLNTQTTAISGAPVLTQMSVNHASRILQDAYVAVTVAPHLDVQVGQFKVPLNFEGLASSYALPLVERSLIDTDRTRGGTFGDLREIGLMVRGAFANGLEYRLGLFNGLGFNQNDLDKDNRKAVAGRLTYKTPVKGLRVGGFGAVDNDASAESERKRMGVDAQYLHGPLLLQAELVAGRDGWLDRLGYYATIGYKITKAAEIVARYDVLDPDTNFDTTTANVTERDYDVGFNYYITGNNLKFQAGYIRKTFASDVAPDRNVALFNLQVAW